MIYLKDDGYTQIQKFIDNSVNDVNLTIITAKNPLIEIDKNTKEIYLVSYY
jgi:hypothetical protein